MAKTKIYTIARTIFALLNFAALVSLFADPTGFAIENWGFLASIQFVPAVLAMNAVVVLLILAATYIHGRIYCEAVCPLGVYQDILRFLSFRKAQGVRRVCGNLPVTSDQWKVRAGILCLFIAAGLSGFSFMWLDPYGIFGRAAGLLQNHEMNAFTIFAAVQFAIVTALVFVKKGRIWCNVICPVGTIFAFLMKFSRSKTVFNSHCGDCRACFKKNGNAAPETKASEGDVTRKAFLVATSASVATAALRADDKMGDGGLAPVSEPGIDRPARLAPPGAKSYANFRTKCVGCQLCVAACPNKVLRPSVAIDSFGQPEMGYEHGWCRPECTKCGEVCPAKAIAPISVEEKSSTHIGHAIWHKDRCIAAQEGVTCTACERHCPAHAIHLIKLDPSDPASPRVPVVDKLKCIGCGACEHLCPARPLPAMTVKGFDEHRIVRPMDENDLIEEAKRMFRKKGFVCAVAKDGIFTAFEKGHGVAPLLNIYDKDPKKLAGTFVVDKVIGRAAAAICILGGVKRVHALTMGEDAAEFLEKNGITVSADVRVPKILNRTRDASCPLDSSVEGESDPKKMLVALRKRIDELMRAK